MKNEHKISSRQWNSWNTQQKKLFNDLLAQFKSMGPELFLHPHTIQRKLSKAEFSTIIWNAAFLAACALTEGRMESVTLSIGGKEFATVPLVA